MTRLATLDAWLGDDESRQSFGYTKVKELEAEREALLHPLDLTEDTSALRGRRDAPYRCPDCGAPCACSPDMRALVWHVRCGRRELVVGWVL